MAGMDDEMAGEMSTGGDGGEQRPQRAPGRRVPVAEAKAAPSAAKAKKTRGGPGSQGGRGRNAPPIPAPGQTVTAAPLRGRPTKYRPEMCDAIYAELAEGFTLESACAGIGINLSTARDYMEQHPEFSRAVMEGRAACLRWWEEKARLTAAGAIEGNARLLELGLRNRSRSMVGWNEDVKKVEVTGADGGPIQQQSLSIDVSNLDADQREQLRTLLLAARTPPTMIEAVAQEVGADEDMEDDDA